MDFEPHFLQVLANYYAAHTLWKALPIGQAKVEAKRQRGKLHSEVLAIAEICAQREKKP